MRSSVALLVALLVTLAACSPTPPPTRSPSAVTLTAGPSSPLPAPTSVALGTLVVQQSKIIGGFYIEGAFAYVEVTDQSGASVARVEDRDYHLAKELARIALPAGRYLIGMYVRSCEGACPALDGPTDGCELTVDVVAGGVVEVLVHRRPGRPCAASIIDS